MHQRISTCRQLTMHGLAQQVGVVEVGTQIFVFFVCNQHLHENVTRRLDAVMRAMHTAVTSSMFLNQ